MCFGKNSHKYYVIVFFFKCGSTTLVNRFFFCLLISQIKNCSRHPCITKFRFVLPSHPLIVTVLVHVKWILLYSYNRPNLKFCRLLFLSIETRKSRHGSVLQKTSLWLRTSKNDGQTGPWSKIYVPALRRLFGESDLGIKLVLLYWKLTWDR